jgi:hypothetical protein
MDRATWGRLVRAEAGARAAHVYAAEADRAILGLLDRLAENCHTAEDARRVAARFADSPDVQRVVLAHALAVVQAQAW